MVEIILVYFKLYLKLFVHKIPEIVIIFLLFKILKLLKGD